MSAGKTRRILPNCSKAGSAPCSRTLSKSISEAGLHMRINPCHPLEQTMEDLKRRLPFLHELADRALERDQAILEMARSLGVGPGDKLEGVLQDLFGRPLPNDAPH